MLKYVKKFYTRTRLIILIVVLVIVGIGFAISRGNGSAGVQTDIVRKQDLRKTVVATGTVTSESDLNLSFKRSGIVSRMNVKVGDKVKTGQVLAMLDQSDASASIAQANAQVLSAKANLDKVINGTSDPDVRIAQVALDNAWSAFLNSTPQAIPSNEFTTAPVSISGTYTGKVQGTYQINLYRSSGGISYIVSGLGNERGTVTRGLDSYIGQGLYINFATTGDVSGSTDYTINIPNTLASDYLDNYNAFKAAEAALAQKKAATRPEDIAAAQASLSQAQATLMIAQNSYSDNLLIAPTDGQITGVDVKIGEQATASEVAVELKDTENLYVEANVAEADIAEIKTDQEVEITLDALGKDRLIDGRVILIDPASTEVSGIVNYKIRSSIGKVDEVKPGMTANLRIISRSKPGVLVIAERAIVNEDGQNLVRVVTDSKGKKFILSPVDPGIRGDGGLIEVISGLSEGQEIITSIGKK